MGKKDILLMSKIVIKINKKWVWIENMGGLFRTFLFVISYDKLTTM